MVDAIVVGAGPAGSMAALVMARAGARVLIVDRQTFPRDLVCGDRVGTTALDLLGRHGLDPRLALPGQVVPLRGWHLRAPLAGRQAIVEAVATAVAIRRRHFDHWLLDTAIQAGARFEPGWHVRGPLFDDGAAVVRGVVMRRAADEVRLPALMVIGADGRDSALAHELRLRTKARLPYHAASVIVDGVSDLEPIGEIDFTPEAYLGVTPVGDGSVNVWGICCGREGPGAAERVRISASDRFGGRTASMGRPASVALETSRAMAAGVPGLLLAGDAAGLRGPLIGDGVYRAMLGGQLAADEALRAIESGEVAGAVPRLDAARRQRLGDRWRERLREATWRLSYGARAAGTAGVLSPRLLERLARQAAWIA